MRTPFTAFALAMLTVCGTARADVAPSAVAAAAKPAPAAAAPAAAKPVPAAAAPAATMASTPAVAKPAAKADRIFTCIATDHGGVKRWEPGTFIVYEGERVQIKLYNRVAATPAVVHGFTIAAFNVKVEVAQDNKDPVLVEFVADKAGLYDINCHLHPAHVGGQLLVLKK